VLCNKEKDFPSQGATAFFVATFTPLLDEWWDVKMLFASFCCGCYWFFLFKKYLRRLEISFLRNPLDSAIGNSCDKKCFLSCPSVIHYTNTKITHQWIQKKARFPRKKKVFFLNRGVSHVL
jgi:hypothetical protein